ncbi:YesL family protein [Cellulomonas sp. 179-A 9B4 NHS]|uniref:YesL family protein n=1 Tax=Cellulomonas sp. 179-A 9B4 NHS TaxID=3142379 RepID=UPI0039A32E6D
MTHVSPPARTTGDEAVGWAARVMTVLRALAHVVAAQLLLALGTLAGGVVLGLVPSLHAAGTLLARVAAGAPSEHLWRDFWATWRGGWRRCNVLGAPLWAVAVLLWLDAVALGVLTGPARAAAGVGLALAGAWAVVVLAHVAPVTRRYTDSPARTWRFLVLAPAIGPGTSLGVLAAVTVWVLTCAAVPVLVPLAGVTVPLLVTGWLVDVRLDRLDAR